MMRAAKMRPLKTTIAGPLLGCLLGCLAVACSTPAKPSGSSANPAPAASGAASASAHPQASASPPALFREDEFVESAQNRDPFRSFAELFLEQAKTHMRSQRQVLLDQYTVDELKLVALVTNIDDARAMLVDPTGKGWIVSKGQFVGKAEIVHAGGPHGEDYATNWRVDRIREGDLVLVREDPMHEGTIAATRVLALHNEDDDTKQSKSSSQ